MPSFLQKFKLPKINFSKEQWSWALYDWGNSAFATTVLAGFFPIFFKEYYAIGFSSSESTAYLGYGNALALLLVLVTAPSLGKFTDKEQSKKKALFILTAIGAAGCIALGFVAQGAALWAITGFIIANFAYATACAPYDSLLVSVADDDSADTVSALGYSLGYLGGGILFALNIWMYKSPQTFGLASGGAAIKASFVLVGLWWLVFTLPAMKWVKEENSSELPSGGGQFFLATIRQVFLESKSIRYFLIAFLLYSDGVGTVIRMAADYGISVGFSPGDLMGALLLVQIIGFPATFLVVGLTQKLPVKKVILGLIGSYLVILTWASLLQSKWEFYGVVFLLGCSQGAIQALSRSYFMRLIPKDRSGQFFGVYNLFGKFAGILGSTLLATVAWLSGSHRLGLASVSVIFILGALFLNKVEASQHGR